MLKLYGFAVSNYYNMVKLALLEKALTINPQGIDPNYFYAEFLTEERDYKAAMSYIEKAKQAAPRPDRVSADQGRLQEIAALEAKLNG